MCVFAFASTPEIIHGLKVLGHSSSEREMFRFNNVVFGMDGRDPAFQLLKLSGRKLQRGDFSRFPHLTSLDLHKNLYSDESLLDSHLPKLTLLRELNLSDNNIKSMRLLAAMMQALPNLKLLRVLNNPGYPRVDSEKARRHLLAYFTNVHMVSFTLDFLNNQKITIDERIEALHYAKNNWGAMHPTNLLDRMKSMDVHRVVARDVALSPLAAPGAEQDDDDEAKAAEPGAAPALGGADGSVPPAALSNALKDPSQLAADKAATHAQILAQGGCPLNLDEDINIQAENARFILTCADAGVRANATDLCLRKRGLRLLGGLTLGLASYESLCIVDLRENSLTDLRDSGIELLTKMHTLDLRVNEFASLESIIVALRGCNALQWLYLQYATKDHDETAVPLNYTPAVFSDLRGLHRCDELPSDTCIDFDPLAKSAQMLLWKIAQIGPNNLKRVDLHNRRLPMSLFYSVLAALYYLDIQELMGGGNNEWAEHPQYSDVMILLLGPKFKWLDGVSITDQRRMLAFRADKHGKESGKITGVRQIKPTSH